jgi:hypothetical protein
MLAVLGLIGLIFVVETMTAGNLLRRHGRLRSMIGPYFEVVIPAAILVTLVCNVSVHLALDGLTRHIWLVPVLPLLALAITGVLRGWHWLLRVVLHASWLAMNAWAVWIVLSRR